MRRELAVAIATAAALLGAGCGAGERVDAAAVHKEAEALRSIAAEGSLLAEDAAKGRTYGRFARAHASELGRTAGEEASRLERATTSSGARASARVVARLAADAERLLDVLAQRVDDREAARRVEGDLRRIADEAAHEARS